MISLARREPTPNPNAFKYCANTDLLEEGTLPFNSAEEAERLPLAKALFALGDVEAVLICDNFVSVSAQEESDWDKIKSVLDQQIVSYDPSKASQLAKEMAAESEKTKGSKTQNELWNIVDHVMNMYVRPALAGDGGGVEVLDIQDKVVRIRYQGACGSCPTSTMQTLHAIERLLQSQVDPELVVEPA